MKKIVGLLALMSFSVSVPVSVLAEGVIDAKSIYIGGGFGFNSLPGYGSARGFQFFGGYNFDFKMNDDISTALEIGYMDSGDFDRYNAVNSSNDATGVWAAAVESVPLTRKVDMLGRFGYDFGDDDGLLLGAGLQYKFDTKVAMRMEYVAREHINGLQVNVLVGF